MLRKKDLKQHLNNERGQAMLESIPLIIFFVIFFAYGLGLFGVIHSGILFSIGARSYAFETFRNRTNTNIFRYSANASEENLFYYSRIGFRFHTVYNGESTNVDRIRATSRPILYGLARTPQGDTPSVHNNNIYTDIKDGERNKTVGVDPAWLMIGYGLCITAECGAK